MGKYKSLVLIFFSFFSISVNAASSGYATSSTSVTPLKSPVSYSRSLLQWQTGVTQPSATTVACPSSSVSINATETVPISSFNYVNGLRTNLNNLPYGWNASQNAIKTPPTFGQTCEILQTDLAWQ